MALRLHIGLVAAVAALVICAGGGDGVHPRGRVPGPPGDEPPAARDSRRTGRVDAVRLRRRGRAGRPARDLAGEGAAPAARSSRGNPTTARRRSTVSRSAATTATLRRLARQLRGLEPKPILRPMPEPNTPWYPWSGEVSKPGRGPVRAGVAARPPRRPAGVAGADPAAVDAVRPVRAGRAGQPDPRLLPGPQPGRCGRRGGLQLRHDRRARLDGAAGRCSPGRTRRSTAWRASRSGWRRRARRASAARRRAGSGSSVRIRRVDAEAARRALVRRPRAERRLPRHADAPPRRSRSRRTSPPPAGADGPLTARLPRAFVRLPCAGSDPENGRPGV